MNAEHELLESWKRIPLLQRQIALQGQTLEEQADYLGKQVDEVIKKNRNSWGEAQRLEAVSMLSLLSEIYAIIDFDKMIEVREQFQSLFPEHFRLYLNRIDSLEWQMLWPGCLECSHFNEKCSLNLTPTEPLGGRHKSGRTCKSKELRLQRAA
ncbi:MAG: hypothetical protein K6T91_09825 [Firmicutes bacterium]|nr:hypothetical protein [Bacillota bacterium]